MNDKTLGQVAYEAWAKAALGKGWAFFPWDDLSDQDGWEGAAQAASQQQYLYLRGRIDDFRALLAEILDEFDEDGEDAGALVRKDRIAEWHNRAGLEAPDGAA